MNAWWPRSAEDRHPTAGASPPTVFTRCMKVVFVNRSPVGPAWVPVSFTFSRTQGIESDLTMAALTSLAQTELVSRESCHETRIAPPSFGLGLEKCVISCSPTSLNKVACGVNNVNATPKGQFWLVGSHGAQT